MRTDRNESPCFCYRPAGTHLPAYSNITDGTLKQVCQLKGTLAASQQNHPTLVGEFSLAQSPGSSTNSLSQAQPHHHHHHQHQHKRHYTPEPPQKLRGGRRHPHALAAEARGPPSQDLVAYRKKLFDTQRAVYEENAAGWALWSWKLENDSPWSYSSGLKHGWITRDLDSRGSAAAC